MWKQANRIPWTWQSLRRQREVLQKKPKLLGNENIVAVACVVLFNKIGRKKAEISTEGGDKLATTVRPTLKLIRGVFQYT